VKKVGLRSTTSNLLPSSTRLGQTKLVRFSEQNIFFLRLQKHDYAQTELQLPPSPVRLILYFSTGRTTFKRPNPHP
jgi:hypothetical protein